MAKIGVYGIRHIDTDRWYVGYSVNIANRWKQHLHWARQNKKSGMMIHAALAKYGKEAFEFVILEICEKEKLPELEIKWIELKNSYECGFNLTKVQQGVRIVKPETIEKLKKSHTGKSPTEETRKKLSEAHKGKVRTPEHCKNLSNALKNQIIPEEQRKKISATLTGRVIPEETRKRMSLGQLRRRQLLREKSNEYR